MKLRILTLLCCISFALMASAQASGGQIRRVHKIPSTPIKKESESAYPKIRVISESEKTCELYGYIELDKQIRCIPQHRKGKYIIPSKVKGYTVVKIGDCAFWGCDISEVEIPSTVTAIGDDAFAYCYKLTTILIPNSVKSIGSASFKYCTSLCDISMPNSIESIGNCAFESCESLSSIKLPDNLKIIKLSTFSECRNLSNISIPNEVTAIEALAFSGCESLGEIHIPSGVKIIANNTFSHCTKLTNVYIPEGVTKIEENAFRYTRISTITLPNSINYIAPQAFYNCERLTKVISHITTPSHLGQDSFNKANSLTLIVPKGTKHLYNQYGWNNFFSTIIEQ